MKRFLGLSLLLTLFSAVSFGQNDDEFDRVDLQFVQTQAFDCEASPNICFDVQMRAPEVDFQLAFVNMRIFFDMSEMEYESMDCGVLNDFGTFIVYQCEFPVIGDSIIEPTGNIWGMTMPRYFKWNFQQAATLNAQVISTEWTTFQTVCFNTVNVETDDFCPTLVWELQVDGQDGWQGGSEGVVVNRWTGGQGSAPLDEEVINYNWLFANGSDASDNSNDLANSVAGGAPNPNPTDCTPANCDDPFPVELLSFQAKKRDKTSVLNWSTTNEINNAHFDVERSLDGVNFNKIGQVAATDEPASINRYEFIDENPSLGRNYYRLNQVDIDGAGTLTYIRTVDFNEGKLKIHAYPNPTTEFVQVDIGLAEITTSKEVIIVLTDLAGAVVSRQEVDVEAAARVKVDMKSLAPGTYLLKVVAGTYEQTDKIVKLD